MIRTNPTLSQGVPAFISEGKKKMFLLNLNTENPSSSGWEDGEAGKASLEL